MFARRLFKKRLSDSYRIVIKESSTLVPSSTKRPSLVSVFSSVPISPVEVEEPMSVIEAEVDSTASIEENKSELEHVDAEVLVVS